MSLTAISSLCFCGDQDAWGQVSSVPQPASVCYKQLQTLDINLLVIFMCSLLSLSYVELIVTKMIFTGHPRLMLKFKSLLRSLICFDIMDLRIRLWERKRRQELEEQQWEKREREEERRLEEQRKRIEETWKKHLDEEKKRRRQLMEERERRERERMERERREEEEMRRQEALSRLKARKKELTERRKKEKVYVCQVNNVLIDFSPTSVWL